MRSLGRMDGQTSRERITNDQRQIKRTKSPFRHTNNKSLIRVSAEALSIPYPYRLVIRRA